MGVVVAAAVEACVPGAGVVGFKAWVCVGCSFGGLGGLVS